MTCTQDGPEPRLSGKGRNLAGLSVGVLKHVDRAEVGDGDLVLDASGEERQRALSCSPHPLVGVKDLNRGHELSDQGGVEIVRAGGLGAES